MRLGLSLLASVVLVASCSGDDGHVEDESSEVVTTTASEGQGDLGGRSSPDTETDDVGPLADMAPAVVDSCSAAGQVYDILSRGDHIYFVGDFASVTDVDGSEVARHGIAACTSDGHVLELDLPELHGTARSIVELGDHLVVGGTFSLDDDGQHWENLVVVDQGGQPVTDWGAKTFPGGVHGLAVGQGESLYVLGSFAEGGGVPRTGVARLDSGGQMDEDFVPQLGPVAGGGKVAVYALAEGSGGSVFIGGDFGSASGTPVPGVVEVDYATGRDVGPFAPDLTDTNPKDDRVQIRSILVEGEDVYLCGDWWVTEGRGEYEAQRNVGRFDERGIADQSFEPWTDGGVRECEVAGSYLILAGHFDTVSGKNARKLALVDRATADVSLIVPANAPKGVLAIEWDGTTLWVGGTFSKLGGMEQPGLGAVQFRDG